MTLLKKRRLPTFTADTGYKMRLEFINIDI